MKQLPDQSSPKPIDIPVAHSTRCLCCARPLPVAALHPRVPGVQSHPDVIPKLYPDHRLSVLANLGDASSPHKPEDWCAQNFLYTALNSVQTHENYRYNSMYWLYPIVPCRAETDM